MHKDMVQQQKLMEESSALVVELADRVRGVVDVGAAEGALACAGQRSGSCSGDEATASDLEDDEAALLRAYYETNVNLWKVHRQTVQLLLEHLDKLDKKKTSHGSDESKSGRGEFNAAACGHSAAQATRAAHALMSLTLPSVPEAQGGGSVAAAALPPQLLRTDADLKLLEEEPAGEPDSGALTA